MTGRKTPALAAMAILLTLPSAHASAQTRPADVDPMEPSAEALVPGGWRTAYRTSGRLDGDDYEDLVLVLRQDDPANIDPTFEVGGFGSNTNPWMLVVALGDPHGFRVITRDEAFLARRDNPGFSEPILRAPSIDGGVLTVGLAREISAGGGYMGGYDYRFTVRDDTVYLSSLETSYTVNRIEGVYRKLWMDFTDGYGLEIWSDLEETEVQSRIIRIEPRPISLAEMGDGLEFPFGDWLPRP